MTDILVNRRSWPRAVSIGVAVGVLTALVMLILSKTRIFPFPKAPAQSDQRIIE